MGAARLRRCPRAIGLRMARPDRPVLAVVGDGSSLYQILALWSAARYGAGVLFVVLVQRRLRDHGPARRAQRRGRPVAAARTPSTSARWPGRRAATPRGSSTTTSCWPRSTSSLPDAAAARRRCCSRSSSAAGPTFDARRPRRSARRCSSPRAPRASGARRRPARPTPRPGGGRRRGRTASRARRCRSSRSAPARPPRRSSGSARASRPWRRRPRRASGRRAAPPTAARRATWRTRPSAGCRPTASRPAGRPTRVRMRSPRTCARARRRSSPGAHDRPVGGQPDRADLADVLPDRLVEHQPEPPPVARHQRDAGADRPPQPVRHRPPARQQSPSRASGARRPQTSSSTAWWPAPATPASPTTSPGVDASGSAAPARPRPRRRAAPAAPARRRRRSPPRPARAARRRVGRRLARSSAGWPSIALTIAGTVSSARGSALIATCAVAQHGHLVAQRHHVLEDVRDEHDADLAVAQHPQRVEQHLRARRRRAPTSARRGSAPAAR